MRTTSFVLFLLIAGGCSDKSAPAGDAPRPAPDAASSATANAHPDTAGLGAQVAAHFPGYRVTSEAEIGNRFPLTDGSKPADYYAAWGSGREWWIWQADTDRDGKQDRIVLLTSIEDPSKDLLVHCTAMVPPRA